MIPNLVTPTEKCAAGHRDGDYGEEYILSHPAFPRSSYRLMTEPFKHPAYSGFSFTANSGQAPAMVIPSIRKVGEATAPRKTRSSPMAVTLRSISARLPAMVTSSTA